MILKSKILLIVTAIVLLFASCHNPSKLTQKNKNNATLYAMADPLWLAGLCHDKFPVTDGPTIVTKTYKEGKLDTTNKGAENKVLFTEDMLNQVIGSVTDDTRKSLLDSFKKHPLYINCPPCPPATHRVDTVFVDSSKTKVDNALVYILQQQNLKLTVDTSELHKQVSDLQGKVKEAEKQKWMAFGILGVLAILFGLYKYFKMKGNLVKKVL